MSVTVEPGPNATEAPLLATFLAGRNVPCPQCGYNLRDLRGDRCPECGDTLVLRVNAAEPRLAAPIAGLVGLSAGAGFSALMLAFSMVLLWQDRIRASHPIVVCTVIGLVAEGPAVFFWIRHWKAVRRLPPGSRWLRVCGCFAMTLTNLICFCITAVK